MIGEETLAGQDKSSEDLEGRPEPWSPSEDRTALWKNHRAGTASPECRVLNESRSSWDKGRGKMPEASTVLQSLISVLTTNPLAGSELSHKSTAQPLQVP